MQTSSQPLTQSPSTVAPDQSAILAPPNLAPDDTDWILTASLTFKVLAGAGELDPTGIAKAIANIALPILELAQKARDEVKDTIKYLNEMLRSVSEEIKLLQKGGSSTDAASTCPLVLKDDLNKIYSKRGFRVMIKRPFQSQAILERINQHRVYIKDAHDKFVATAVFSMARQVIVVDAKVNDIHNHLMSSSRIQPVNGIMLSAIPPPASAIFLGRDDLVQEGIVNLLVDSPHSIIIMGFGGMGKTSLALKILNDKAIQNKYKAHRYFIPCDVVCSVQPTVEVLLQTITQVMTLELTSDVVKQLHAISKPTILVFDNFETLWDKSKEQYRIQMILEQLNAMKPITLMITMRGTVAPIDHIDWLILPHNGLSSLDESVSLDLFSTISKYSINEKEVKELVKELDGWPLAIMLMAYQAKTLTPQTLLKN
ncbi:P-loop containing nucleoside triphosphate hydrolase protein [Armillaria mellea]|nr:P-loop containing nucleoside triphosphate hydrolase protein [Armillaria mellea]